MISKELKKMITAIYSLGGVHGAEIWLVFWLVCAAAYFGICAAFKSNRGKSGMKEVLFWGLIAEFAVDLIWAVVYYCNISYVNYGVGAVYGLIIWPIFLAAGIIATVKNKRKI